MTLALLSSQQVFQRVDSAVRSLFKAHRQAPVSHARSHFHMTDRPLRVVHIAEEQRPPLHTAGRMVISGRMADVCAELDRMIDLDNQRQVYPN
jgi:hypothetical protein